MDLQFKVPDVSRFVTPNTIKTTTTTQVSWPINAKNCQSRVKSMVQESRVAVVVALVFVVVVLVALVFVVLVALVLALLVHLSTLRTRTRHILRRQLYGRRILCKYVYISQRLTSTGSMFGNRIQQLSKGNVTVNVTDDVATSYTQRRVESVQ